VNDADKSGLRLGLRIGRFLSSHFRAPIGDLRP
jgi:hypothetical protein